MLKSEKHPGTTLLLLLLLLLLMAIIIINNNNMHTYQPLEELAPTFI